MVMLGTNLDLLLDEMEGKSKDACYCDFCAMLYTDILEQFLPLRIAACYVYTNFGICKCNYNNAVLFFQTLLSPKQIPVVFIVDCLIGRDDSCQEKRRYLHVVRLYKDEETHFINLRPVHTSICILRSHYLSVLSVSNNRKTTLSDLMSKVTANILYDFEAFEPYNHLVSCRKKRRGMLKLNEIFIE
ncbi:hypothetical protein VNO77_10269 [Canavalia gladiata]|uniref:Uncharacterized protein n=1 Tax=Canavalia gladiata TaxID=3824 RepID=A0AAN9MAS3_CANGL